MMPQRQPISANGGHHEHFTSHCIDRGPWPLAATSISLGGRRRRRHCFGPDGRFGRIRARRRGLHLWLSSRHDGDDPPGDHQCRRAQGHARADGPLIKLREYPNASFRDVTAPNADTLYTTAFFDVGNEPWVVSLPDLKDRYFLFPMLDGWTDGLRRPGQADHRHRRADIRDHRPGWEGTLPEASGSSSRRPASSGSRAHLLHRHARGLRGGPRDPGRVQARTAQRLRQGLDAAAPARSIRPST